MLEKVRAGGNLKNTSKKRDQFAGFSKMLSDNAKTQSRLGSVDSSPKSHSLKKSASTARPFGVKVNTDKLQTSLVDKELAQYHRINMLRQEVLGKSASARKIRLKPDAVAMVSGSAQRN